MEIKERDLSIVSDDSSFGNSERSRQPSLRGMPNADANHDSVRNDLLSEKHPQGTSPRRDGEHEGIGGASVRWNDLKTLSRHSC